MSNRGTRSLRVVAVVAPVLVVVALIFAGDQVSDAVPPYQRASIVLTATIARAAAMLLTAAWLTATLTLLARALRKRPSGRAGTR